MAARALWVSFTLILSACHRYPHPPADAYQRWTDQTIVRLGLHNVQVLPCKAANGVGDCYKMEPARRWRGAWMTYFEAHRFCPGAHSCSPRKEPRYDLVWTKQALRNRPPVRVKTGTIYIVDFVGRRTEYPVASSEHAYPIVVDRLISIKEAGGSDGFAKQEYVLSGE